MCLPSSWSCHFWTSWHGPALISADANFEDIAPLDLGKQYVPFVHQSSQNSQNWANLELFGQGFGHKFPAHTQADGIDAVSDPWLLIVVEK
jgi:hypothetical protein